MKRLFVVRSIAPLIAGLALALTAPCASAAAPKRVLILDSFGRDIAPFNVAVSALRTTLAKELGEPVDIHEASLEAARFVDPVKEAAFADYLKARFEGQKLDLVVPVGAPAVKFVNQRRERLFPNTPIVFTAVDPRLVNPDLLKTNATLVTQKVNLPGIIEDILQLQPSTTNIIVIFGASPLEKFWTSEMHREFLAFTNKVHFSWLNDLSLDGMLRRVANPPPRSFILFVMLVMDATGVPYDNDEAFKQIHEAANAPIYGYFHSQFGSGAIGGRLYQDQEVGLRAARAAIRVLRGERADMIAPEILGTASPVYDWRELRRWGIKETALPKGSTVQFRRLTIWEEHKWGIIGIVSVCLGQAVLVILLVSLQLRRKRAEAEVRKQREELSHVARVSTMGELAASMAHELNQPLGAILSNAEAAELFLEQDPPRLEMLRAILADIRKDDERAGEVIRRMRALLRKHELELQPLDLQPLVREVLKLIEPDAALRKTALSVEISSNLPRVPGDRIHLQQVLLNLLLNAMDAMANQPPEQRRIKFCVGRSDHGAIEISVSDSGPGIAPEILPHLFEPFFTTKQSGMGMGLSIARRIVEAHNGRIWAENDPAGGAIFHIALPIAADEVKTRARSRTTPTAAREQVPARNSL